jgi:hypothetical protein
LTRAARLGLVLGAAATGGFGAAAGAAGASGAMIGVGLPAAPGPAVPAGGFTSGAAALLGVFPGWAEPAGAALGVAGFGAAAGWVAPVGAALGTAGVDGLTGGGRLAGGGALVC